VAPETDYVDLLSRSVLFYGAAWNDLAELVPTAKVRKAARGDVILNEGDLVQGLHILIEGSAEVLKGGIAQIAFLEAGNFFGEISLFGQSICATATVRAASECTLLIFGRQEFDLWLEAHPASQLRLFRNLATELCNRLHSTTERYLLGVPTKS
jgi:CRP-like cAMP-binding protein